MAWRYPRIYRCTPARRAMLIAALPFAFILDVALNAGRGAWEAMSTYPETIASVWRGDDY